MSEFECVSDCDTYYSTKTTTKEDGKRKQINNGGKRKATSRTTTTNSKKKTKTEDIFGISRTVRRDINEEPTCLSSFFVNRVANGYERRTANTNGEYYVDLKVYKSSDAFGTETTDLWKKALLRLKLQANEDSPQWRKLQAFVRAADELFEGDPKFYNA